jgi:hypothetical protein
MYEYRIVINIVILEKNIEGAGWEVSDGKTKREGSTTVVAE